MLFQYLGSISGPSRVLGVTVINVVPAPRVLPPRLAFIMIKSWGPGCAWRDGGHLCWRISIVAPTQLHTVFAARGRVRRAPDAAGEHARAIDLDMT